ncbi:MAG: methyltransferase domain-containing protein [Candidatus Hodarchaeota archaeon]
MNFKISKIEQEKLHQKENIIYKGSTISRALLKLSNKYIGKKVLEIGGGDGSLYKNFITLFGKSKNLTSIDLVPKSKHVMKGDSTNLYFPPESFDTVISADLIEHLNDEDLIKGLQNINKVLKLKGYGIFSTPNNENLSQNVVICPDCGKKFHRVGHCQKFDKKRVKLLFENYGFKLIYVKELNFYILAKSYILTRLLYKLKLDNLPIISNEDLYFIVRKVKNL